MIYQTLCDRIYNKMTSFPDFPAAKIACLLRQLPPGSRDIPALFALVPYEAEIDKKMEAAAAALVALTLCLFIHDDVTKNRAFGKEEAVLNGDFLLALALSLLPAGPKKDGGENIVKAFLSFNESRLAHKTPSGRDCGATVDVFALARADYGLFLKEIALAAARDAAKEEAEQKAYGDLAEAAGTLWGLGCEGYPGGHGELSATAGSELAKLPWAAPLTPILASLK